MMKENNGIKEMCNIQSTFKPMRKKKRSLIAFLLFYIFGYLINVFFIYPYIIDNIWIDISIITVILVMIFFSFSWLKDPGYLVSKEKGDHHLLSLLQKTKVSNICADCEIVKPLRSKHCEYCHKCVSVYDHHCPWINNCVGVRNHSYFIVFLVSVFINLLY